MYTQIQGRLMRIVDNKKVQENITIVCAAGIAMMIGLVVAEITHSQSEQFANSIVNLINGKTED